MAILTSIFFVEPLNGMGVKKKKTACATLPSYSFVIAQPCEFSWAKYS